MTTEPTMSVEEAIEAIDWFLRRHKCCEYKEEREGIVALLRSLDAENKRLLECLSELATLVRGECPSLLNEDSGGNAHLSMEIDSIIYRRKANR